MALAPFFERVYGALGGHLAVSRESLTALLEKTTVGIGCAPRLSQNERWIADLTTNLLARLYPKLAISGPQRHCSALQELASKINPEIEFAESAPGETSVCIGSKALDGAIYPSASGWVARLSHSGPRKGGPENPYASGAAATLASAELFRRIFLKSSAERDVSVSLLDYSVDSGADRALARSSVYDVLFVAVGAIGNGALWALGRDSSTEGHVILLDNEDLTLPNLQRYVLGSMVDVSRPKIDLAQEALGKTRFSAEARKITLEDFADANSGLDFPTICISVDNVDSRRAAQALLPRLIVNGWTGESALGVSWHVFSNESGCLACLYHPHGRGPSATEQAAKALGLSTDRATVDGVFFYASCCSI